MDHSLEPGAFTHPAEAPRVRHVGLSRPFAWLRHGARDLARTPRTSLAVGALVATIGWLLMAATWKATYVAPALLGGFLLVAPFIAMAVYALSRQVERGDAPDAAQAWGAWRENAGSIALFGLLLALAYLVWERLAAITFALFYTGEPLHPARLPAELLAGGHATLVLAFLALGAVVAAVVFAISVVSAPLLVDRPVDAVTAVLTSLRCCARSPLAMLLWAALIVALTVLGFATLMIGLVVIFPWLAHASWHAYRDMVEA